MDDEELYWRSNAAWKVIQRLEREFGVDFVSQDDGGRLLLLFPQNIDPDVRTLINKVVSIDLEMVNMIVLSRIDRPDLWPCSTPPTAATGWA